MYVYLGDDIGQWLKEWVFSPSKGILMVDVPLCDLGTHSILTYEMRARKEPTWLHFVRVKYNNLFAAFNTVSDLR